MVLGIGIDTIEHSRLARYAPAWDDPFIAYTFTQKERLEAKRAAGRALDYFAGRFCVKEATIKALNGLVPRLDLKQIETLADASGAPMAFLAAEIVSQLPKGTKLKASITHEEHSSCAVVLALTDEG